MTVVELLLYWLAPMVALVYILGYSLLFEGLRTNTRLPALVRAGLQCPMCIAFWVGLVVGGVNWMPVAWPAWLQFPALGAFVAVALEYLLEVAARRTGDEEAADGEEPGQPAERRTSSDDATD